MRRRAPRLALAAMAFGGWLLAATPASACSVCFGAADSGSPLVSGAQLGVFFLLGVTIAVLGGLTRFFFHLRARARQAENDGIAAEWANLQRSALR